VSVFKKTDSNESREFWQALEKNLVEVSRWPRWMQSGSMREEPFLEDDVEDSGEVAERAGNVPPSQGAGEGAR
jgi:hypothetical protein